MKIYKAGDGHKIEDTEIFTELDNFLISFFYLNQDKTRRVGIPWNRFKKIVHINENISRIDSTR